jgi:hypothetical protein
MNNHFTKPRLGPYIPMGQYAYNAPFMRAPQFNPGLDWLHEAGFQQWRQANQVPYDASPTSDYDMKGFYRAFTDPTHINHEQAFMGNSAYDGMPHYTDFWKTPYHDTFSTHSQYAQPVAPRWFGDMLFAPGGAMLKDETPAQEDVQSDSSDEQAPTKKYFKFAGKPSI